MKSYTLLDIVLSLFDGGAAAGGDGGGAAGTVGTVDGQNGEGTKQAGLKQPGNSRRAKTGGLNNVVYGTQPSTTVQEQPKNTEQQDSDAGSQKKEPSQEDKRAKWRELIDTEYKDIYTQEFQTAFDRRFKNVKETEERLQQQQPVLDMLMQKYKIADGDMSKLSDAMKKDDALWSLDAEEAGLTNEQYRNYALPIQELKRENEEFKRMLRQNQNQQAADQQLQKWYGEATEMKSEYPDFDLSKEVQNPQFLSMLKANVPVRHAYEVLHLDVIKNGVAKTAAQQTEKNVVDGIRAKGSRPVENGVSSQSGITIKSDVSMLTRKDREEIAKRVARGEQISF